jgi:hypothetical protein
MRLLSLWLASEGASLFYALRLDSQHPNYFRTLEGARMAEHVDIFDIQGFLRDATKKDKPKDRIDEEGALIRAWAHGIAPKWRQDAGTMKLDVRDICKQLDITEMDVFVGASRELFTPAYCRPLSLRLRCAGWVIGTVGQLDHMLETTSFEACYSVASLVHDYALGQENLGAMMAAHRKVLRLHEISGMANRFVAMHMPIRGRGDAVQVELLNRLHNAAFLMCVGLTDMDEYDDPKLGSCFWRTYMYVIETYLNVYRLKGACEDAVLGETMRMAWSLFRELGYLLRTL